MKVVADEKVGRQIVERLRADGHDVLYVAELDPGARFDCGGKLYRCLKQSVNSAQRIEKRLNHLWRAEERVELLRLKAAVGARD